MALIVGIGLFVASVLTATFSRLIAEEFTAWIPSINRRLVNAAVVRLPGKLRDRFEEEWRAYLDEVPGDLGKLLSAMGFVIAAQSLSLNSRRDQIVERWLQVVTQLEDCYHRTQSMVRALRDDPLLPPSLREELSPHLEDLEGKLAYAEDHRSQLAAKIASTPAYAGLVGYLICAASDRVIGKGLAEIGQRATRVAEQSDRIRETAADRTKGLAVAGVDSPKQLSGDHVRGPAE